MFLIIRSTRIKPQDPAIENKYFFEPNMKCYEYYSDVPQTDSRITLHTTLVALNGPENSPQIKGNQWGKRRNRMKEKELKGRKIKTGKEGRGGKGEANDFQEASISYSLSVLARGALRV